MKSNLYSPKYVINAFMFISILITLYGCSSDDVDGPDQIEKKYLVRDLDTNEPVYGVQIGLYDYCFKIACADKLIEYGFTDQNGEVTIIINQEVEGKIDYISAIGLELTDWKYQFQTFEYNPKITEIYVDPNY